MSRPIVLKGVSLLGETTADLVVRDGVIVDKGDADAMVVEASGLIALPGLVDLHTHLREPGREDAVTRLIGMLEDLIKRAAKDDLKLAPFIGIGCPGVIRADGTIDRGGQNLPGNWEVKSFNLPALLREAIPKIGDHETLVVMHNDAVVQGLSEVPHMRDVQHWGVLTIGTGLGNARFTNRELT